MRAFVCFGLLGTLTTGCFNPGSDDPDTDVGTSTTDPTTGVDPDPSTSGNGDSTSSGSTSVDASSDGSTTSTSSDDTTTGMGETGADASSSSDGSSSTGEPEPTAQCEDGIVVAGEVCFESFFELDGTFYRFGYLEDLDDDGDADLLYSAANGEIVVRFNADGEFGLATSSTFNGVSSIAHMGFTDYNLDDVLDGILVSTSGAVVYTASGNTSGDYVLDDGESTEAFGIAVGNMNGLAGDEFVVPALDGLEIYTVAADGTMTQTGSADIGSFGDVYGLELADLNGDDQLDVVYVGDFSATAENSEVRAQLGSGDGTLSNVELFPLLETTEATDMVLGDFDGDDEVDIAVADGVLFRVAFGNGALGFDQVNVAVASGNAATIEVVDADLDGIDDLIIGYDDRDEISIVRSSADRSFADPVDVTVGHIAETIETGDMNGDGVDDIVVSSFSDNALTVIRSTN
ncbi:MAG: VCBS repeat-containing protein [Myxococcota bacterium]